MDEVLSGNMPPRLALKHMCDVVRQTDHDPKYMDFYWLDDEIDSVVYDGHAIFTNGLNKNNADEFILNEFRLFRKILDGNYSDYDNKAICNACQEIMVPILTTKFQFKNPFWYQAWTCAHCKSRNISTFSSQAGKKKIIEKLSGNQG